MIQVAAKTIASLAMFGSLLFAGVYRCVHAGDDRRRWYCIVCLLWEKEVCNACGFHCCTFDGMSRCGCDWCENPACWDPDDDDYERDCEEYDEENI